MDNNLIEKMRELLALAKSSNQHEAELAAQQASDLIKKHRENYDGPEDLPDPRMVAEFMKFQARNPWYDVHGRDVDSARANRIDEGLSAEGVFDPNTPEYWSELDKRVRRSLPDSGESLEGMSSQDHSRHAREGGHP